MKTLSYRTLLLCAIACLSACSSYNYYTAGLNKTNMSGYHSFAWLPAQGRNNGRNAGNSAYDLKVKDAAVSSLNAKGLRLQNNDPDLLVTYSATVGRGSKTVYAPTYYGSGGFYPGWGFYGAGYGWGWRPYYYSGASFMYYGGSTAVDKEHYKEGTIIIDLIDTRSHKIVWRGFGVGEVHKDPKKNIDDLPKVVSGIIDQLQLMPSRRT